MLLHDVMGPGPDSPSELLAAFAALQLALRTRARNWIDGGARSGPPAPVG